MSDIEILRLKNKGYCCSQILVALFLDLMETENMQLLAYAKGLCIGGGMEDGPCGILQCGVSVISMYCPEDEDRNLLIADEFKTSFLKITGKKIYCGDIIGESYPVPDYNTCGSILSESFSSLTSILAKYGIDPTESPEYA